MVTGIGVVSSLGIGKDQFWENLINGTSGISDVTLFDTKKFKRHYAGEIKDFNPADFIKSSKIKFLGRASAFAAAALKLAVENSGFELEELSKRRIAVLVGTTMAEANVMDVSCEMLLREKGNELNAMQILNTFAPSIARNIAALFKLKGKNVLIPTACAAGNYAIGYGYDLIKRGIVDSVIAGGAEALSRVAFQGFQRLYAMAPQVCSPFDKDRKGMILGEGAGIMLLESEESAIKRKAPIYGEILGYGLSCDATHMTIPNKIGVQKSMAKAVKDAGILLKNIDYVCVHGTGTVANDKNESQAIKELFEKSGRVPLVSSIKSMLGHTMGAAAAIEAIACCLALKEETLPPTINFSTPDPECDIDCIPNQARKQKINYVLNNGFAFGGNNCCVVMGNRRRSDG